MNNETLRQVPLADIEPSATNPRKQFNGPDWPEFVANVKAHGVIQPAVGRDTQHGKIELVCGERRYRASQEAGLATLPLVVRELTDAQVVEMQQIENLQRADLPALEEAQGYADWRDMLLKTGAAKTAGEAVAHIAEKISRKRSTVYGRLALLKIAPAVRTALTKDGALDASLAGLVAMIPDPKQQEAFWKQINSRYDGPMSVRSAQVLLDDEYRTPLRNAPFDVKKVFNFDKALPNGRQSAGPCKDCPCNTSNLKEQFPDAAKSPNVCTLTACYQAKTAAHTAAVLADAKTSGRLVLTREQALNEGYSLKEKDATCYEDKDGRSWGALGKAAGLNPRFVVDGGDGALKEVFTRRDQAAIKTALKLKSGGNDAYGAEEAKKRKLKAESLTTARGATAQILAALVSDKGLDRRLWRLVADEVAGMIGIERESFVAKRRGLAEKLTEVRENLEAWLTDKARTDRDLQEFVVEGLLCAHHVDWGGKITADFENLCQLAGGTAKELNEKSGKQKTEMAEPKAKPAKPAKPLKGYRNALSPAAKARIIAAQKARWAKIKAAAAKT